MSNQEILEKALRKAIDGGWDRLIVVTFYNDLDGTTAEYIEPIIFNHDFAKALWGEEIIEEFPFASEGSYKYSERQVAWKKHLQQMVVADDPIKYLGENI